MPIVSILIPVFNRRNFIHQCIQSALDQTFDDFEVVVVDNASDDGTWEICQEISNRDSRVKIFRNEKNIGPVRNWFRCVEEARGEYGKFLFSDDLILKDFLAETVPKLADQEVAFISTSAFIGKTIENSEIHYSTDRSDEVILSAEYMERLASGMPPVPVSPGAALFRMVDIRENLILDIPVGSGHDFAKNGAGPDVLLFALTAKKYKSVVMLQKPLVFFRAHTGSFSVANEGNSVTEGYRLSLAWFFMNFSTIRNWAYWVAKIWLIESKNNRKILSPFTIGKKYSGDGSVGETINIISAAVFLIIKRIIRN